MAVGGVAKRLQSHRPVGGLLLQTLSTGLPQPHRRGDTDGIDAVDGGAATFG